MSIFVSASTGGNYPERKPLEAGAYAAICDMVVDLCELPAWGGLHAEINDHIAYGGVGSGFEWLALGIVAAG